LHEPFLERSLTGFNVPGLRRDFDELSRVAQSSRSWFKVGKTLKTEQFEEQTSLNEFQHNDMFKDFGAISRAVPALLVYPKP